MFEHGLPDHLGGGRGGDVATYCQISGTAAAGTYTLQATRGGLTTALSGNVAITAGTATKLALSTQPTVGQNIQAKGTGTFSVSVSVQDATPTP